MHPPLPLLLLGLSMASAQDVGDVRDRTGDGAVFLEWSAAPTAPYVGQMVELTLRCGVERTVFGEQLVQPFRQPLDVPLQVLMPGLGEVTGIQVVPYEEAGETTIVLGTEPVRVRGLGPVARGGVPYVTIELTRTLTVTREGDVVLPAPRVHFATSAAFREDLVLGRIAVDRDDAVVLGAPLTLTVRGVPEEGRPLEFAGALGRFEVWATADRRTVEEGQGLRVTVDLEGPGHPGEGLAHWPEIVPGFHVQGRSGDGARRVVLELVPEGVQVTEVPALGFVYFDPEKASFERAETEPIPVDVHAAPPAPHAHAPPPRETEDGASRSRLLYLAFSISCLLLVLLLVRRRAGRSGRAESGDPRAG